MKHQYVPSLLKYIVCWWHSRHLPVQVFRGTDSKATVICMRCGIEC